MKVFDLDGEVGWNIDTYTVKSILRQARGEDITINFSSPGGSVFTGIKVFNLFKNYAGKVKFHLTGLAASMGSYIVLSGDEITAEPNAVFMIHNVSAWTGGDHRELRKTADLAEGLTKLLSKEYVAKTGESDKKIRAMMDDETFLFGSEIKDAGFVDSIVGEEDSDPDAKQIHMSLAKESFEAVMAKVKEEKPEDYEEAAAILPNFNFKAETTVNAPVVAKQEIIKMNLEKLKAEHPALYAQIVAEGHAAGVVSERDRVVGHLTMGNSSGDMKTAEGAIKDGSAMTAALQATYMSAAMNRKDINNRTDDDAAAAAAADGADVNTETDDAAKVADIVAAKLGIDEKGAVK